MWVNFSDLPNSMQKAVIDDFKNQRQMKAKAKSLKKVNAEIQKQVGNYTLRKEHGYFYVTSDDLSKALKLIALYTASIQVSHLNHQTIEQWVSDVKEVVSNIENS